MNHFVFNASMVIGLHLTVWRLICLCKAMNLWKSLLVGLCGGVSRQHSLITA